MRLRSFFLLLVILPLTAVALPARAEFMRRTSADALVHWDQRAIRMPIDPRLEELYGPAIYDAIAEAADAWAIDPSVPSIELAFGGTAEEHDLAVAERGNWIGVITENWPFGDQLAVTVSTIGAQTGRLVSTQVWINGTRPMTLAAQGDQRHYDLRGVLTHELGHVLGLGEAEHAPEATMYPTFRRGETRQRTLAKSDEVAVAELYAQFAAGSATAACAASPGSHSGGLPLWAPLSCSLLVAVGLRLGQRPAPRYRSTSERRAA